MMLRQALWCAVAVVVASGFAARADTRPDPFKELDTAIPAAIRLLEVKDYKSFLEAVLAPDDLKERTGGKTVEEFAEEFGAGHATKLLEVLKDIKDKTPAMDSKKQRAIFIHDVEGTPSDTIEFKKVAGHWYIKNH